MTDRSAEDGQPVAVLTGASSGIGSHIAAGLARAGFHLVLPVRNAARADAARVRLDALHPAASAEFPFADLSSLAETAALADAIRARHPTLALLVNNAGIFRARRERTGGGHDSVLATNHLSPHLLTQALLPALLAQPGGARVVTVGSSTADRARLDPAQLELGRRWSMTRAYASAKLAITMSTLETARRLAGTGVVANVVHPGMVATGLVRSGGPIGLVWRALTPFILTEAQGADTPLHVALDPDWARITGRYAKRRRPVPPNKLALDPVARQTLWDTTERLIAATVPSAGAATTSAG